MQRAITFPRAQMTPSTSSRRSPCSIPGSEGLWGAAGYPQAYAEQGRRRRDPSGELGPPLLLET